VIKISNSEFTIVYISIPKEDDGFIDSYRLERIKKDKQTYTKNQVVKMLLEFGIEAASGKWLKLDPNMDEFISKLQNFTIETNGNKITIRKTKEQVYAMLVEKGLQHMND
jgi:subtilisin-like proprotein convertase family protein